MRVAWPALALMTVALAFGAGGPIEYGQAELRAAAEARGLPESAGRVTVELSATLPEDGFEILGSIIRGGSPRGVMYGLLEAADQLRDGGRLKPMRGVPRVKLRSVRRITTVADWTRDEEAWLELFSGLARERFNRLHLMLPDPLSLERIATLKMVSAAAHQRGVDLAIGLVEPEASDVAALISSCPAVRAVHVDPESAPKMAEPVKEAGRYMVLESSDAFAPAVPVPLRIGSETGAAPSCDGPCSRYVVFRENAVPPVSLTGIEGVELEGVPNEAWRVALFTMSKVAVPVRRAAPAKRPVSSAKKSVPANKTAPAKKTAPTKSAPKK